MKLILLSILIFPLASPAQDNWFSCKNDLSVPHEQRRMYEWISESAIDGTNTHSTLSFKAVDGSAVQLPRYQALVSFKPEMTLSQLRKFLIKYNLVLVKMHYADLSGHVSVNSACDMFKYSHVLTVRKKSDSGHDNVYVEGPTPQETQRIVVKNYFNPEWVQEFAKDTLVVGAFVDLPVVEKMPE